MKIAVTKFLGTNCDLDVCHAVKLAGGEPELVFFTQENLDSYDIKFQ